jgi:hypothetical protein
MSRKRSQNFSEAELEILIDGVERNRSVLFSKLSNTTTIATKSKIWETICSKVNSANSRVTNAPLRSFVKNGQLIRAV